MIKAGARIALGAAVAATIVAIGTTGSSAAGGRQVIGVHPGKNAISKAIKAANPGDTLRIHSGTYHEALTIDKPLTLVGVGNAYPAIDAGCKANDAIHVTSGGVTLVALTVEGAAEGFGNYPAEIFFDGTATGTARRNRLIDTCNAEYGLSAFDTGPIDAEGNNARGFNDSGIYIGSISNTHGRTLLVRGNRTVRNARGIIVEDSNAPAVHITIKDNHMNDNTLANDEGLPSDGLFLTNSDHVLVKRNTADGNTGSGYHPNASSDHNVFMGNIAQHDGAGRFLDEGTGNCGRSNNFAVPHC